MRSELPTTDLPNVETYTVADHPLSSKLPTATVNVESCRIEASGRVARRGGTCMVAQRAGLRPHAAYGTDLGADTACLVEWKHIFRTSSTLSGSINLPTDRAYTNYIANLITSNCPAI